MKKKWVDGFPCFAFSFKANGNSAIIGGNWKIFFAILIKVLNIPQKIVSP